MKNFLTLCLFMALSFTVSFAQNGGGGQNDAPVYGDFTQSICHDDGAGNFTGYTRVMAYRIGDNQPVKLFTLDDAGLSITEPTTGTISIGNCSGAAEYYDWESHLWCDNGTQYYQMIKIIRDAVGVETVTISNVNQSGAIYTPSGNEKAGKCSMVSEVVSLVSRTTSTATGTVTAGDFIKVVVYNVGLADGTITVGAGGAEPLKVGENYMFEAYVHPLDGNWYLNPLLDYNATGTEFRLVVTPK